jgi:hypothetical protein
VADPRKDRSLVDSVKLAFGEQLGDGRHLLLQQATIRQRGI